MHCQVVNLLHNNGFFPSLPLLSCSLCHMYSYSLVSLIENDECVKYGLFPEFMLRLIHLEATIHTLQTANQSRSASVGSAESSSIGVRKPMKLGDCLEEAWSLAGSHGSPLIESGQI